MDREVFIFKKFYEILQKNFDDAIILSTFSILPIKNL